MVADEPTERVRYTITFNPKLPFLPTILKKNWQVMVDSDQRLQKAFPAPPMACLKRGPNLGDKLIRSKIPPVPRRIGLRGIERRRGFKSCKAGRRVCSLCPFTGLASDHKTVVQELKIEHSGLVLDIKEDISCRDSFCLYILSCRKPGCMKQYAGMSTRPLYIRFAEHLSAVQDPFTTTTVGKHWQLWGHNLTHLEIIGVEKLGHRCPIGLRQREIELINKTGLLDSGLNVQR